jgi:hypothetical protein
MSSVAQMWPELELFLEAMSFQRMLLFQIFIPKNVAISNFQCWLQINYKE